MKISFSLFVILIFISACITHGQKTSTPRDFTHRDPVFPFQISYPTTWKKGESSESRIRLEVISDYGKGLANFAIAVTPAKGSEKTKSSAFVKMFLEDRPDLIQAIVNQSRRNAKITSLGRTYLANQDAFFVIFEGQYKALDETYDLKSYLLETLFEGNVYAITFTTSKDEFENQLPVFKEIASSFGLIPTNISLPNKR